MRTQESLLALVTAVALAVALTWPIAARFATAGRIDSGDGRYSIWNVAWVAHALTTNPSQLYQANIFHPHRNTLALSEANLVAGAMAVPVWIATRNAIAASNSVILLSFALSSLAAYTLVRRLTRSRSAAALSAIAFGFCPYAFSHIPHVQLLMTFVLPLALLCLHNFVDRPSLGSTFRLGAAVAFAGLACGYYGIFAGLAVAFGIVWFGIASGDWRGARYWLLAFLAAAIAIAIVWPFFAPYRELQAAGFERTLDDARVNSADWRSYLASPKFFDRWWLPALGQWRDVLFPGLLPLLLSGFAVAAALGRGAAHLPAARPVVGFYVAVAALAFWASLGPPAGFYALLHSVMPFFTLLRAPARFGVLVTLAASVLAGIGVAGLLSRVVPARRRLVIGVAIAAALVLSIVGPLAVFDAPPVDAAYRRLASLPPGPVAEFPYFTGRDDRHRHTEYMLASALHWKPLINGYSDHTPADVWADMPKLADFPAPEALGVLRERGVRYVLVHWRFYEPDDRPRILTQTRELNHVLRPMVEGPEISLYEVVR